MIKALSKIEVVIENRSYQLLCDTDSPLAHVKDALFQFSKHVGVIEDHIAKLQQEQKEKEEASKIVVDKMPDTESTL